MSGITLGGAPRDRLLVDCCESWSGFHGTFSGNSQGQISDVRQLYDQGAGASSIQLFPSISGALAALTFGAVEGRTIHPFASIAAVAGLTGGSVAGQYAIPMYASVVAGLPAALWPRPFRRYRMDFLVRGTVGPGAADCALGISMSDLQGMVTGGGITHPTAHWVARNGLNGGNWTVRYRLANGGAYTIGPDSGIAFLQAALVTQLSVEFEEGPQRKVRWLANGRQVHQIVEPTIPAAQGIPVFSKAMGAGAGVTVCNFCESRLRVWEIS